MIRLLDLLEDIVEPEHRKDPEDDNYEIHIVQHSGKFKARNDKGDVRYFTSRDAAQKFLKKGTHHAHDFKDAEEKERKQAVDRYDLR